MNYDIFDYWVQYNVIEDNWSGKIKINESDPKEMEFIIENKHVQMQEKMRKEWKETFDKIFLYIDNLETIRKNSEHLPCKLIKETIRGKYPHWYYRGHIQINDMTFVMHYWYRENFVYDVYCPDEEKILYEGQKEMYRSSLFFDDAFTDTLWSCIYKESKHRLRLLQANNEKSQDYS